MQKGCHISIVSKVTMISNGQNWVSADGWASDNPESLRKTKVMINLLHPGVVFKHKRSKILWKVVEVIKMDDGTAYCARVESLSSGYKKHMWPSEYSYDNFILHEAPEAIRILYGDDKHGNTIPEKADRDPSQSPETAEIAFEETDLSEIDPGGDT